MNEVHVELLSLEALSPAIFFPQGVLATWALVYGTPAITEPINSSSIQNPDGPNGTNSVSPQVTHRVGNSVISNPTPFWWPDNSGLTQGGFHSTPYTGPPQPITN